MKITVVAVGKIRDDSAGLCREYLKRLKGVVVTEVAVAKSLPVIAAQNAEAAMILKALPSKTFVIVCDERGKDLSSREFAAQLTNWQGHSSNLTFVIGGADGVTDEVRGRAQFLLGFGRKTWPHRLARVMLLEQLYRAQQINAGHPYHRD